MRKRKEPETFEEAWANLGREVRAAWMAFAVFVFRYRIWVAGWLLVALLIALFVPGGGK